MKSETILSLIFATVDNVAEILKSSAIKFYHFTPFLLLSKTTMSYLSIMGCCFFCSIYTLLHQDYWSNWLQLQQSLMLSSRTYAMICLQCCRWHNPWWYSHITSSVWNTKTVCSLPRSSLSDLLPWRKQWVLCKTTTLHFLELTSWTPNMVVIAP